MSNLRSVVVRLASKFGKIVTERIFLRGEFAGLCEKRKTYKNDDEKLRDSISIEI